MLRVRGAIYQGSRRVLQRRRRCPRLFPALQVGKRPLLVPFKDRHRTKGMPDRLMT